MELRREEGQQAMDLARLDAKTRQVIALHVGGRSRESAKQLWANLPAGYQHHATFYTDLYEVYTGVIPPAQHKAITIKARKTNHLERVTVQPVKT
jgi:IS1 family transposase